MLNREPPIGGGGPAPAGMNPKSMRKASAVVKRPGADRENE